MAGAQHKPKISILVPCYNVANYLPQCLDSIVNQTLKDLEIICINDGSTDDTLKIIKKYAKHDPRIVVIDKQNEGYGKSMNRGLDIAHGQYIAIVESDDWIERDAMKFLYDTAQKNNADMVKAEYVFFDSESGAETQAWPISLSKNLENHVFCPTEQNANMIWTGHPSIWTCLYSHKLLKDNHIQFVETPGATFQDMGFKVKTLVASTRFLYTPRVILHYRKHANNSDKNNGKVFAVSDTHDDVDNWLLKYRPDLRNLNKILNRCRFANYVWNLWRLSAKPKSDFRKRFTRDFRKYYESNKLEKLYFDDKSWLKLLCIVHPYNPIFPIWRAIITIISPLYKTRIRSGYLVHYLFNNIIIKRTKLPGITHK